MKLVFVLSFLTLFLPALAEEPWSVSARHPVLSERPAPKPAPPSLPARALDAAVRFYQKRVSPLDGPKCHLYPTCSAYAREALARHGAFIGTIMTLDRLVQEAEVLRRAPRVRVFGHARGYDPLEANDFWWAKRRRPPALPSAQGSRESLRGFRRRG